MNNTERFARASELRGQLRPLISEKIFKKMNRDYLTGLTRTGSDPDEHTTEINRINSELDTIDMASATLYEELRNILVRYRVSFVHNGIDDNLFVTTYEVREIFIGIDVKGEILHHLNAHNPDVDLIISEARNHILHSTNAPFSITYIIQI